MIATCVNCKVALRLYMNGVNVVEYAEKRPYRIWSADEWCCPFCNLKVVIRFAKTPIDSSSVLFKDALREVFEVKNQGKLREVFERPASSRADDEDDLVEVPW